MRQVLAQNLRPGDTIESRYGAVRVTDLPATCFQRGDVSVLVPVSSPWRSRELTYAPSDFVAVIDRPIPSVIHPLSVFAASVIAAGALFGAVTTAIDHTHDNEAHDHVGHHQRR